MSLPLLHSKLVAPPLRTDLVSRARLIDKLEPRSNTKALLITAPAGFGKTTLVGEWLKQNELSSAWLSLDARDNEVRRLLAHLFSAVNEATGLGTEGLELLSSAKTVEATGVLAPLLNEAAELAPPLYVVLDDYHLVTNEDVHEAFDFVLEYAPESFRLCFISRNEPPLKLARLRARAQLLEVRADDLRFNAEETLQFLENTSGESVSEEDATALATRAEGWAAALQVMALGISGRGDNHAFIDEVTHSNRYLLDYLLDEVVLRQREEVQDFLLATSVLDKLCPELCSALLIENETTEDAASLLAELTRANLFLRPLGGDATEGKRVWFRYHQLFKDVLYQHLRRVQPSRVAPLHKRAAEWFADSGYTADALLHLLAGGHQNDAADLLTHIAPEWIWQRGDAGSFMNWLDLLPASGPGRPDLLVWRAWAALLLGDISAISPLLDEAERNPRTNNTSTNAQDPALSNECRALRGFVARMNGHLDEAEALSSAALKEMPQDALGLRSLLNGNLGEIYYLRGELDRAHDYHAEESRLAEHAGAVLPSRFALWRMSDIETLRGDLEAAKTTNHTMLGLNRARSVDALGFADVQLGVVALEQYDLVEAEHRLSRGLDMGRRLNNPRVFVPAYGPLSKTLLALGRADEAQEVLDEGKSAAADYGVTETWGIPSLEAWQAYLDLRTGQLESAISWVHKEGLNSPENVPFTRSFDALVAARILQASRKAEAAIKLLELPSLKQSRFVELAVLTALGLNALEKQSEALDALDTAIEKAAPDGHVFTFVDEGEAMRGLLGELKATGRQLAYTTRLLEGFPESTSATSSKTVTVEVLDEELNERELSVLRLMAGRLSNKEIARELDLSTNTVKWYAKAIFDKLNVHGRLKAASKAKELGLI